MSALNVLLPDSLHEQIRQLAEADNISMNQFIALAVSEKVAALRTIEYLKERGQRGDREKYEGVLDKIVQAGQPPLEEDQLPASARVRLPGSVDD